MAHHNDKPLLFSSGFNFYFAASTKKFVCERRTDYESISRKAKKDESAQVGQRKRFFLLD